MNNALVWLDGELLPAAEAQIPVLDHGLLYGDGVFEGIRFHDKRVFRLAAHLRRLHDSARAIALRIPLGGEDLYRAIHHTVQAYPGEDGYIRLLVTRGVGPLGISTEGCEQPRVIIIVDQVAVVPPARYAAGLKLASVATRRAAVDVLDPRIKSLNYLASVMARLEAQLAGADEALLLNQAGRVAEGAAENLFVVRDHALLTPPSTEGALAGITRGAIMEVARDQGIPVHEQSLSRYDVYTADECLLCGTGAGILPVREVDGRSLRHCPGPVTEGLQAGYRALLMAEDIHQ